MMNLEVVIIWRNFSWKPEQPGSSQVPQPTCYWKWVGFPIPLKQANLTLRASSSAILRYSVLNGCFLSSYGSQRALTPM